MARNVQPGTDTLVGVLAVVGVPVFDTKRESVAQADFGPDACTNAADFIAFRKAIHAVVVYRFRRSIGVAARSGTPAHCGP